MTAAVVLGCGGGTAKPVKTTPTHATSTTDSASPQTAPERGPLSRACLQGRREMLALGPPPQTEDGMGPWLARLRRVKLALAARLAGLPAPKSDVDNMRHVVALLRKSAAEDGRAARRLANGADFYRASRAGRLEAGIPVRFANAAEVVYVRCRPPLTPAQRRVNRATLSPCIVIENQLEARVKASRSDRRKWELGVTDVLRRAHDRLARLHVPRIPLYRDLLSALGDMAAEEAAMANSTSADAFNHALSALLIAEYRLHYTADRFDMSWCRLVI